MTFERFNAIKKYFHVFDNESFDESASLGNKAAKLDGLISYFNKRFIKVYWPERELALDENMCSWSGKGGSKVYMPLKPVKYGMKIYALCEAKYGYACSLNLYNNKIKDGNVEMIKKLTPDLKFLNHHIYMHNFYTST